MVSHAAGLAAGSSLPLLGKNMNQGGPHEGTDGRGEGDSHSLNGMLDVLSHPQRRIVLEELGRASDQRISLDELTTIVLDRTAGTSDSRRIELQLYHNHLPKLENEGLVEYNWDSSMVAFRGDDWTMRLLSEVTAET